MQGSHGEIFSIPGPLNDTSPSTSTPPCRHMPHATASSPSPLGFFSFIAIRAPPFSSAREKNKKINSRSLNVTFSLAAIKVVFLNRPGYLSHKVHSFRDNRLFVACMRVKVGFRHLLQFVWPNEGITESSANFRCCKKPSIKA